MTDQAQNTGENEQSFAELFEASYAGQGEPLNVGDKISARIISIGAENVYFDTGTKVDGVADKKELLDAEGNFPHKEGESIDLYVVSKTRSEIVLSRALAGAGGYEMLQNAKDAGLPVDGRVKETCKGGFSVEIMGRRAFCPVSQIDARFVEDTEAYVGNTYPFLISKLEERGRNIVVTRRALIERERQAATEEFLSAIKPGEEIEGTVVRLTDFGAFVDLGGLDGLVHVSEISWSRVNHPSEVLSEGQTVKVKILGLDQDRGRISLSIKQAEGDPWSRIDKTFAAGQVVDGKVMRTAGFGAFVEIAPGIEGLVHISQLSYDRVEKTEDAVSPGDEVKVKILSISPEDHRVSLSIKETMERPAFTPRDDFRPERSERRGGGGGGGRSQGYREESKVTLGDMFGALLKDKEEKDPE